jgi:hypothetical protein
MLKTLLGQAKSDLRNLELYSVAATFKKMLSRMNNRFVSQLYRNRLETLKGKIKYIQAEQSPTQTISSKTHNKKFLKIIPYISKFATAQIPNLTTMAANAAADKSKDFRIYNKDTCAEFHELLCEMLVRFHLSLDAVQDLQKGTKEVVGVDKKEVVGVDDKENSEPIVTIILRGLNLVLQMGRILREIVRGDAIQEHLRNIAPLLEVNVAESWPMSDVEEEYIEFHVLKPYSMRHGKPLLPWQSYRDWLALMVLNIDSVLMLDHYLRRHDWPNISIKVLYPSLPDQKMLPWKTLLLDDHYFPPGEHPSNQELITFLTLPTLLDNAVLQSLIKSVLVLKQQRNSELTAGATCMGVVSSDIDSLVKKMQDLQCSLPGWEEYSTTVIHQMNSLKDCNHAPQDGLPLIQVIVDMLKALQGVNQLYDRLKAGTPLSTGTKFKGMCHCEIYLASLNSNNLCNPLQPYVLQLLNEIQVSPVLSNFVKFYNIL